MLQASYFGAAIEYQVASYFLRKGCQVYWPSMQQGTVDMVVSFPEEGMKKVQVKKASWSYSGYGTNNEYLKCSITARERTPYLEGDWDYLVIASDGGRMWLIPWEELPDTVAISLDKRGPTITNRKTDYDPDKWRIE